MQCCYLFSFTTKSRPNAVKVAIIIIVYYAEAARHIDNNFYRAMLCIRGTSHGPVSVCVCVCHKSEFY